jgi:hypothetical protein
VIEIRFRDIDPDTGDVSQDRLIAICDSIRMSNWVKQAIELTVTDEPNREIYTKQQKDELYES